MNEPQEDERVYVILWQPPDAKEPMVYWESFTQWRAVGDRVDELTKLGHKAVALATVVNPASHLVCIPGPAMPNTSIRPRDRA